MQIIHINESKDLSVTSCQLIHKGVTILLLDKIHFYKILYNVAKINSVKVLIAVVLFTAFIVMSPNNSFADSTIPDQPRSLTAFPISPTSASLYWNPPLNNGNSSITYYTIEYKTTLDQTYHTSVNTLDNKTKYNYTGLVTDTTYIFHVIAVNAKGSSPPSIESAPVKPTSTSTPPKNIAPNPPTGLTATSPSGTQINLSWTPPANNAGPPVTGYRIDYQLDNSSFITLVSNSGSSSPIYSHTNLQTGHTYTYRVFAINSVGTGNSSNTAFATPVQVNSVPEAPGTPSAYSASPTSISISWTAPQNTGGSPIIGYKIEYYNVTSQFVVLVSNTGNTQTTYLHTGLVTGTSYTYRVTAINSLGPGTASNTATATPNTTTNPTITNAIATSPTQVSMSWIPPSNTYGQTINGYRIDQLENGQSLSVIDDTGSVTSYTIPNLTTGKSYVFTVTALLSGGTSSNPSSSVNVTPTSTSSAPVPPTQQPNQPPTQTPGLPNSPTQLNATLISSNTVKLSWIIPTNTGNSQIMGYKVEYKIGSSGTWNILNSNVGVLSSYVQSGLLNGTTYIYRVSTLNNVGSSQPSNEAAVTPGSQNPSQSTPPPIPQVSAGNIIVTNTDSSISYHILGAQMLGVSADSASSSLDIKIKSSSDGILILQLPRDLIDAKKSDGTDIPFYVLADKSNANSTETTSGNYRTVAISFPSGTSDVSIHGTFAVPEFPIAYIALIIGLIPVLLLTRRKLMLK